METLFSNPAVNGQRAWKQGFPQKYEPKHDLSFSLFISVAITNLFRDHTPAFLLRRKRTMKCRVVNKNI